MKSGECYYLEWLKQQAEKEQTHPVCLHAMDQYENVENVNTQNDYETKNKRWIDKTKTDLFFVSCKCV